MCSKAVLNYLESTNRPYSVNDILQNLHNAYSKNAIQSALDELAKNGNIREKVYGKQKVYCIIQKEEQNNDDELVELNENLNNLTQELHKLQAETKKAEATLKDIVAEPQTEQAKAENERLEKVNSVLAEKLKVLKSGTSLISEEEKQKVKKKHDEMTREMRKRKRMLMEMFDAVLENYPKSKAALIEESGLDM